jgi:AcrR family transcriptional regulator
MTEPSLTSESTTRERTLDVSTGLFRGYGYAGTSVAEIGKRVGISGPALYHHFPDKQRILFHCCQRQLAAQISQTSGALSQPTPVTRLREFVRADCLYQLRTLTAVLEYGPGIYSLGQLLHELPGDDRQRIDEGRRRLYKMLRTIIADGIADGSFGGDVDATAASFALFAATRQTASWFRPGGRISIEGLSNMYAAMALRIVDAH